MRAFLTCAILTVTTLTVNAAPADAHHGPYADLVDGWFHRYLGRHVDPTCLRDNVDSLRDGTPIDVVEANILSSPEYYVRNGNTPEGFVAALYRDVLGRRARALEFSREVNCVLTSGRTAVALRLLHERALLSATPVVVASSPLVVTRPAPVIVARPELIDPVVVVPAYRHGPVYTAPRAGISIRFGIR